MCRPTSCRTRKPDLTRINLTRGRARRAQTLLLAGALAAATPAHAADEASLPPPKARDDGAVVVITASTVNLIGEATTSSEGIVTRQELALRPAYRVGQLLETIPGLVVTAHSGEGKANQYLLRGFNLDHGTDLATDIDDMPVNARTHTHGQGYTDLNFFMPELASRINFTKGPYYASEGDFASVGSARIGYVDQIANQVSLSAGTLGDQRVFASGTTGLGQGRLLAAGELVRLDGPWEHPDAVRKVNAVLRYSEGTAANGFSVTGMLYRNTWNSTTDQPSRAVEQGLIGRFGSLDPSDGGNAARASLSARVARSQDAWQFKANAYVIHSRLTLWNDFTHFLDDPVNGDQHGQNDQRTILGGAASASHAGQVLGRDSSTTLGLQTRADDIDVDLQHTLRRAVLTTDRSNHVQENSVGLYAENTTYWTPWWRSIVGAREDYFHAKDRDLLNAANSGAEGQALFQPKASLVFGPFASTELYVSAGRGFHSNDARAGLDPSSGAYVRPPLLVKSIGSEIGMRSNYFSNLQLALTFFKIDFDSELVYNADAGATEGGRPSHRRGVELTTQFRPASWLEVNANLALSHARYRDNDAAGNYIEDAPDFIASGGVLIDNLGPWSGSLAYRRLGPHPLTTDNLVRSNGYAEWNLDVGYQLAPSIKLRVDVYNLLNKEANAADYFYTSRLAGEPAAGVEDRHSHPLEPRSLRVSLSKTF